MANQHFFKPLLPGFSSHLTIPVAFFLKNIVDKNEHKTAELRSDTSKIKWEVKIDGQRLTDGWNEFALAHDLQIGDFLVFRQERNMRFHVTILGPSCCEIQYVSCLDNQNKLGKIQRKNRVKKHQRRETKSSLEPSCFVANVSASTLRYDRLNLPRSFVKANGLNKRCGEIVLMNEKGKSWTLDLKVNKLSRTAYIKRGWRSFCLANGVRAGSFFTFKLIQKGKTLLLRFSSKELEEEQNCSQANEVESLSTEIESHDEESSVECSSSASPNRFVTVTLTPYNVRLSRLSLPIPFTKMNGIKNAKKMSLLDKHGMKWSTRLLFEKNLKRMRLVGGWKEFCDANGVKIGESIMLELIWEADRNSVLKFCSKVV